MTDEPRYFARPMEGREGRVWEVIDRLNQSRYPNGTLIPDGMVFAVATENAEQEARQYAADANREGAEHSELARAARKVIDQWRVMDRGFEDDSDNDDLIELLDLLEEELRHHA